MLLLASCNTQEELLGLKVSFEKGHFKQASPKQFSISPRPLFHFKTLAEHALYLKSDLAGPALRSWLLSEKLGIKELESTLIPQAGLCLTQSHSTAQHEKIHVLSVPTIPSTTIQERSFLAGIHSPKPIYHGHNGCY